MAITIKDLKAHPRWKELETRMKPQVGPFTVDETVNMVLGTWNGLPDGIMDLSLDHLIETMFTTCDSMDFRERTN